MIHRYLQTLTALSLVMILTGCIIGTPVVIPEGYYPAPQRVVSESLPPGKRWPGTYAIRLPGVQAPNRALFLHSYFSARFSRLSGHAWHHPGYGSIRYDQAGKPLALTPGSAFDRKHAALAMFEPALPLASEIERREYQQRVLALGAVRRSLRYGVDEEDIRPGEDYLGALLSAQGRWDSGVVRFFPQHARLEDENGERVYGIFIVPRGMEEKTAEHRVTKAEVAALYYDRKQRLFYHRTADGKPVWLAGVAHPEQRLPRVWAGDRREKFTGIKAVGGSCGASVRMWLSKKYPVPDSGYYHLGFGQVRYDQQKQPVALNRRIAFDADRAQNLVFEPAPPLKSKVLQDYQDRLTVLAAKRKPLLHALEDGDLQPGIDYIAASRGSEPLSHTGILRFHAVRSKGQGGRTVYGELIHNWNPKRRRGPMNINALYQDPDSGLLFWINGHPHRKMWIYGVGEPPGLDAVLSVRKASKTGCDGQVC